MFVGMFRLDDIMLCLMKENNIPPVWDDFVTFVFLGVIISVLVVCTNYLCFAFCASRVCGVFEVDF